MKIEVDTSAAHDKYWLRAVMEEVIETGCKFRITIKDLDDGGAKRSVSETAMRKTVEARSQVLEFVEGRWISVMHKRDSFHTVTMERLFELYLSWCGKKDWVPECRTMSVFGRRLFVVKPEWMERRKRIYISKFKRSVLIGVRVNLEEVES